MLHSLVEILINILYRYFYSVKHLMGQFVVVPHGHPFHRHHHRHHHYETHATITLSILTLPLDRNTKGLLLLERLYWFRMRDQTLTVFAMVLRLAATIKMYGTNFNGTGFIRRNLE